MSYKNEEGFEVKTSANHRARGRCCKSACLHCPYGFTLKNNGLKFEELDSTKVKEFLNTFTECISLNLDTISEFRITKIKGVIAALIRVDKLFVTELYHAPHFDDQDLTKELIESYFFY